jgi:antibiotic biosynthesis monooxygenase (ABM) superfamily enzyme
MNMRDPITVSIIRTVKPGCEADFERALHDFVQRSLFAARTDGREHRAARARRRFPRIRNHPQIRQSRCPGGLPHLPEYLQWNALAMDLTEGIGRTEQLGGLESWFTSPGAPLLAASKVENGGGHFPGVFPTVAILSLTIGPALRGWSFVIRTAVFNACVVVVLTWLVMPLITRLLHACCTQAKGNHHELESFS